MARKFSTFDDVIAAISDKKQPLTTSLIQRLSNISEAERQSLIAAWGGIPLDRRRHLLKRMIEILEADFEMDFGAVTRLALTDLDDELREAAVDASWTDESGDMMNRLMPLASIDIAPRVRAAAMSALGRFILQGELGKFDRQLARQAENVAIRLYNNKDEDPLVRRRALEAIANCSRSEVSGMVKDGYASKNPLLRIGAVFAMGRTCDAKWAPTILSELSSDDPEMRFEAARSAGELELEEAVPQLAALLDEGSRQIMKMAIWALGEIGSAEAQQLLEDRLEQAESSHDDELLESIEEALAAASLAGDNFSFDMM